jgi:hypothetical protein
MLIWYYRLPYFFRKHVKFKNLGPQCHCGVPTMKVDTGDIYQWQCIGIPGKKHCGYCQYVRKG